jgi:Protein of unknown function (DUF3551)
MRNILAVLAISATGLLTSAGTSNAEITYPWCAQYQRDGRNCGFSTLEQCRATVSGTGGYCEANAMYRPTVPPGPSRRR